MVETAEIDEAPPSGGGGKGLLIGLLAAMILGGAGFYGSFAGLIPPFIGGGGPAEEAAAPKRPSGPAPAFVPIERMVISLGPMATARHLQFAGQIEVEPDHSAEVAALTPRVLDVLNTYLRAVDERDLEDPSAMTRLRAQMLRRVQIVIGEGKVRDLLITEFVLN